MRHLISILIVASSILSITVTASAQEASFEGLGDLPGGLFVSNAYGVSPNGIYVVGNSIVNTGPTEYQAFIWDAESGMVALPDLPNGFSSHAFGVSNDGLIVVGYGLVSFVGNRAIRWVNGVPNDLGILGDPGSTSSSAQDVSSDGLVVVGQSSVSDSPYGVAFRWENNTMVGLGVLPGGQTGSSAFGVSADGSVVVGWSSTGGGLEAFRWENNIMTGLGFLQGGSSSSAAGVFADGLVVVGSSQSTEGTQAFRWVDGVMTGLGILPGHTTSAATAASADGSVVVGFCGGGASAQPFIWDEACGMRDLQIVLETEYDLDLTGWTLRQAWDVSGDGTVIVGSGLSPNGPTEAFRAVVSCGSEENLILFREADDSSWGWGPDGIPGLDHVGILFDDGVYESHPGYRTGDYVDPVCGTNIHVQDTVGVQQVHSYHTFRHDSTQQESDAANVEAAFDDDLASPMKAFILTQMGEPFFNPDCSGILAIPCMVLNLAPPIQKHLEPDNTGVLSYTCVGLIERAAEEVGHNDGDGFISPVQESFDVAVLGTVPMLSPQIMAFVLNAAEPLGQSPGAQETWLGGLLAAVDFILTDPLGRRLGHTLELGTINEIPDSLFTGDGIVEQVAIMNPVPGTYAIQLVGVGVGEPAEAAFGGSVPGEFFQDFLDVGETAELTLVFPEPCAADLDGSGDVGVSDFLELLGVWGPCPPKGDCPADFDSSGDVGVSDFLELLGNWGPCP